MAKLTPYAWQEKDLAKLRSNGFTGLIATQAGGGKSLVATLALIEANPRIALIVAPKSTHNTAWIPTIRDNSGITPRIIGNDNKATKEALADYLLGYDGWYMCSPQFITRSDISAWSGDMIVWDEIHMAGANTPKSKLQRKISGYSPAEARVALNTRFPIRLALSATPFRSDFAVIWGVTRFLWPELNQSGQISYDNFVAWQAQRQAWTEVYTSRRDNNGQPVRVRKYLHEKIPGKLMAEMPCLVIHKRRERCCDHPDHVNGFLPTEEPQVIERTITLTPAQRKAIRQMNDTMMTYLASAPLIAEIPLTAKMRVRQMTLAESDAEELEDGKTTLVFRPGCKSPVIDEIVHILSNLPENEPVVVYTESRRFAEVAVKQLQDAGFSAAEYSGATKANLDKFGTEYQVLVGVVSAVGTGTAGLNHKSCTEIFADQPISLTMLTQTSARLDRLDNTRRVQRYVLLDDEGVQAGRLDELWQQELLVRSSLRV